MAAKERRKLDPNDPRLVKALSHAKAARRALLTGQNNRDAHSDGCSCNLCIANRLILSVFDALGEVEAELAEEKRQRKADIGDRAITELQARGRNNAEVEDDLG